MLPCPAKHFCSTLICLAIVGTGRAEQGPSPGETEFEQLLEGFGQINTIAGNGSDDDCNDWSASMEGGLATSADLSRPHMAQADAAGNVYIADKEGHAIRVVNPDGRIRTVAGNGVRGNGGEGIATDVSLREPNGLFTFADGTTYILEVDDNCAASPVPGGKIRRLGTDGMLSTVIDDPELLAGRGLWVSADESLIYYCSGTVVKRWTSDGGLETFSSGFAQLGNLDIDPTTGLVCVTDRFAHLVYRLAADGSSKTIIAGTGNETGGGEGQLATASALDQVRGIAFRPDGSFFVCTHKGEHAVWFVDTAGLIWKFIDGANNNHSGDGFPVCDRRQNMISEPRAVTIAPNGDLLITENDDGYIRRITNLEIEPLITNVAYDPGSLTLTWNSQREASYRVEESLDLSGWTPVLDVETSNGPSTTAMVGTSESRGFVRVVEY
ncbi:MAG: hypothetical protein ACR2RV_27190 [Verrucomicrobiales bacterium]